MYVPERIKTTAASRVLTSCLTLPRIPNITPIVIITREHTGNRAATRIAPVKKMISELLPTIFK